MTMSNVHNAHLLCANSPLIHYARRRREEMTGDDAGSTCCNIQFYTGRPPMRPYSLAQATLVQSILVDDPVTCVICVVCP